MGGFFLGGGSALLLLLPVVLVLGLIVVLALQRDDDGEGNRSPAIYGAIVAFAALFALLLGVTGAAAALVNFSRDNYGEGHDAEATALVSSTIVALVAGGILVVHRELFDQLREAAGAAARVRRAYALLVCLMAVLLGAVAGGTAVYEVFRFIAPSTFGGDRGAALRSFVPAIVLFVGSAALWQWHWRQAEVIPPAAAP